MFACRRPTLVNVSLTCARTICMQIRRRVLTEEAHLSRGKNTYIRNIFTRKLSDALANFAWGSWPNSSALAKQDFRSTVFICEWVFAWPERMLIPFIFRLEEQSACSQAEKRKCSVINHGATTNLSPGFNFNAVRGGANKQNRAERYT